MQLQTRFNSHKLNLKNKRVNLQTKLNLDCGKKNTRVKKQGKTNKAYITTDSIQSQKYHNNQNINGENY